MTRPPLDAQTLYTMKLQRLMAQQRAMEEEQHLLELGGQITDVPDTYHGESA
jgi:hypothetical protein